MENPEQGVISAGNLKFVNLGKKKPGVLYFLRKKLEQGLYESGLHILAIFAKCQDLSVQVLENVWNSKRYFRIFFFWKYYLIVDFFLNKHLVFCRLNFTIKITAILAKWQDLSVQMLENLWISKRNLRIFYFLLNRLLNCEFIFK